MKSSEETFKRNFTKAITLIAELQRWRPISTALLDLWLDTARALPQDEDGDRPAALDLAMKFADATNKNPADFFRELKLEVRRLAPKTTNHQVMPESPLVCDERIKFTRMAGFFARRKHEGCPYGGCKASPGYGKTRCFCVEDLMAPPVTEQERAEFELMANPMADVLGIPAPDPKEHDLGWQL